MREMLRIVLRRDGYDVTVAANGTEAIDILKRDRIDLLLSDIRMPDISGVEVLRAAKEVNRDLVAFMMTAFASTGHRRRSHAARRRGLLHQAVQHGRTAAEGPAAPRVACSSSRRTSCSSAR